MKKHDTPIYKFKVCAAAVFLCGLFTVFAVGCSQKTDSDRPQQSASIDVSALEVHTRRTFPELSNLEPDPSLIRTLDADVVTIQQFTLGELSISDNEITTIPPIAVWENEKTETRDPFLKETMATAEDVFVIGEDTTATMVYGFNG